MLVADTAREEALPINEPVVAGRYDLAPRSVIVLTICEKDDTR